MQSCRSREIVLLSTGRFTPIGYHHGGIQGSRSRRTGGHGTVEREPESGHSRPRNHARAAPRPRGPLDEASVFARPGRGKLGSGGRKRDSTSAGERGAPSRFTSFAGVPGTSCPIRAMGEASRTISPRAVLSRKMWRCSPLAASRERRRLEVNCTAEERDSVEDQKRHQKLGHHRTRRSRENHTRRRDAVAKRHLQIE